MGGNLLFGGIVGPCFALLARRPGAIGLEIAALERRSKCEVGLTSPAQLQIDLGQKFGIEQGAVMGSGR